MSNLSTKTTDGESNAEPIKVGGLQGAFSCPKCEEEVVPNQETEVHNHVKCESCETTILVFGVIVEEVN